MWRAPRLVRRRWKRVGGGGLEASAWLPPSPSPPHPLHPGLLSAQLLVTALVAAPIVAVPAVKVFVLANSWLPNLAMFASLGLILAFMVSEQARQRYPLNMVLLFSFTAAEGLLVGMISSQYQTSTVVLALALTASLTTGLAIYAMRTKTDFTASGGMLFACLLGLLTAGFFMVWLRTPAAQMVLAGAGALLFCAYIVFDVQMIVGGHHQYKMSPDDYVMAAITVCASSARTWAAASTASSLSRD